MTSIADRIAGPPLAAAAEPIAPAPPESSLFDVLPVSGDVALAIVDDDVPIRERLLARLQR